MTEKPQEKPGFWHTLPGILTAVAAVITALGGLLAVLFQVGVFGGPDEPPPAQAQSQSTSQPAATTGAVSPTSASPAGKPWADVEAVWTAKDGTVTRMPARTMGFCINSGAGLFVNQSQNIAFEKMVSVEIIRSDVALSPGGRADVRIVLTSGDVIDGTIDAGCDFIGNPPAGRINLYPDRLQRVEFVR